MNVRSVPLREGDVRVIAARGELDAEARALLWMECWAALAEHPAGLVMDLSAAAADGAPETLPIVVAAAKTCRAGGAPFAVVVGESPVRAAVEVCGLGRRLDASPSLRAALAAVAGS